MSHESSVKEWRERAEEAEAKARAYERQIRVMAHMLEERDAQLRQIEFNQLAAQIVEQERSPDGPPPLVPVDDQGGDHESAPDLESEVE